MNNIFPVYFIPFSFGYCLGIEVLGSKKMIIYCSKGFVDRYQTKYIGFLDCYWGWDKFRDLESLNKRIKQYEKDNL